MAVTFIEKRKKLRDLVLVLVIVILTTVFVLWLGFFVKEKPPSLLPSEAIPIKKPVKKIEINYEVFKEPLLKKLQPLEPMPPFEDEAGRENPFIPY